MPNSNAKPYIFLACTQSGSPDVTWCRGESAAIASLLRPFEEGGGAKVIQAREGSRVYVEDVFFQKQTRDQISLLYIAGQADTDGSLVFSGRAAEVRLSPVALAEVIGGFGHLDLLILSGIGTPALVTALIAQGVRAVLALDAAQLETGVAREFCFQLVQGKSLRQALEDVQAENDWTLRFEAVRYDAEAETLAWDEGAGEVDPPTAGGGLIIAAGAREHLDWRLRNPLLIPIREKDRWASRRKDNQTSADELPNARLRKVRRNRPYPSREWAPAPLPPEEGESPDPKSTAERPRRKPTRRRPIKKPQPVTAPDPEPPRWPQYLRRTLYAVMAIFALLGLVALIFPASKSWFFPWTQTPPLNEADCPFADGDPRYRILILPFQNYPTCTEVKTRYQERLTAHIQQLVAQESLPLAVKTNQLLRACGKDADLLHDMAGTCHADLIVWGHYYPDTLTGQLVLDVKYYSPNKAGEQAFLDGTAHYRRLRLSEAEAVGGALEDNLSSMIYWALAMRRLHLQDYDAAIDLLGRIDATHSEVQDLIALMLTRCYEQSGQLAQAEQYYDYLIDLRPDDAEVLVARAELRLRLGRQDSSLVDYERAVALDPDHAPARLARARLYHDMGEPFKALPELAAIIRAHPEWAPAYKVRAQVFQTISRPFDALRDYDQALALDSTYAEVYYHRAGLHYRRGNLNQANADIEQALAIRPAYPQALLFVGDMLAQEGKWGEAVAAYSRIIERQPSAEAHLVRATAYRKLNQLDAAIADLTEALHLRPTYTEARWLRGQLRAATGAYRPAIEDFSTVISLQPGKAEVYCLRGQAWSKLGINDSARRDFEAAMALDAQDPLPYYFRSLLALERGDMTAAMADVDAALSRDSRSAHAYLVRGRIKLAQGQTAAARQDLSRALSLDATLADAYAYRGLTYLEINSPGQARRDFEQALVHGSLQVTPYLFLGDIHREQGEASQAAQAYTAAIQLRPQDTTAYLRRAALRRDLKEAEGALADLSQAIALGAKQVDAWATRGEVYHQLGQYTQALGDFNRVIRQHPDSARLYCLRGLLYRDMGKLNQALEDFTKALDLNPRLPEAYFSQGVLQQGLGAYPQALEAYSEAITLAPRYVDAYNKRGEIYVIQEDFDHAVRDFNEAIRLDRRHAPAYNNLGDLFRKAGDYPRAIRNYTLAVEFDPGLADAWYYRGFIYSMQRRYREAVEDIRRSLEIKPNEGLRLGLLAKIYARQQEDELFFEHIELALKHDYPTLELTKEQAYQPYREDPRFLRLLDMYQR